MKVANLDKQEKADASFSAAMKLISAMLVAGIAAALYSMEPGLLKDRLLECIVISVVWMAVVFGVIALVGAGSSGE